VEQGEVEPAESKPSIRGVLLGPSVGGNVGLWVKEARRVSPKTKVVMLKFFESYAP